VDTKTIRHPATYRLILICSLLVFIEIITTIIGLEIGLTEINPLLSTFGLFFYPLKAFLTLLGIFYLSYNFKHNSLLIIAIGLSLYCIINAGSIIYVLLS